MDEQDGFAAASRFLVDEGQIETVMREKLHEAGNSLQDRNHGLFGVAGA